MMDDEELFEKLPKKNLLLYQSWRELFDGLTDEQAGSLIKQLYRFSDDYRTKNPPSDPMLKMLYGFMTDQMQVDYEKWLTACRRKAESKRKWWEEQRQKESEKQ